MSGSEDTPLFDAGPGSGDEDWKAKAQAEKERLASEPEAHDEHEIPPASFLGLLEELSLRALFGMGQLPDPRTGQPHLDLGAAHYTIELLGVLEEKTKGNLDETEAAYLSDLVYRLRMAFVEISRDIDDGPDGEGSDGGEPGPQEPRILV